MKSILEIDLFVRDMNKEELNITIEAVRRRDDALSRKVMREFTVGDRVYFIHKNQKVSGEIMSVGRTRFSVMTNLGQYRVPASMLKALDN